MEETNPASSNPSDVKPVLNLDSGSDSLDNPLCATTSPTSAPRPRLDVSFLRYLRPILYTPYDVIWQEKIDRYIVTDNKSYSVVAVHPCDGSSQVLCSNRDGLTDKEYYMQPKGIASVEAEVFLITDSANNRILQIKDQKCSPWGTDELRNKLGSPAGIAISPKGLVYVADYANKEVHMAKQDGTYVASFGECYLQKPRYIALNSVGHVHVVDETSSIHIFKENGELFKSFRVNAEDRKWSCRGVAIDKYDNIVVTAREATFALYPLLSETVLFYDSTGEPLDQIVGNWFEFNCIRGLCFDYKRNRLVVVNGKGRCFNVYKLYADGHDGQPFISQ